MADIIVGIDVGSTNVKVVAFDLNANQLSGYSERLTVYHPKADWSEYDLDETWEATKVCLSRVADSVRETGEIKAIGITSVAETGVPIDEHGKCLFPGIAWYDPRTEAETEWWDSEVGANRIYEITGVPLHPKCSISKIMWLRQNEPEVFAKTRKWLSVSDFVAFRLTGECCTDPSLAGRTMAFDITGKKWAKGLIETAGLEEEFFPEVRESGASAGIIRKSVAREIGLPVGTYVSVSGHDHICASFGARVVAGVPVVNSTGTAEGFVVRGDSPVLDDDYRKAGWAWGCDVIPDRYTMFGTATASGAAIEWLRRNLSPSGRHNRPDVLTYEDLICEAKSVEPGCLGMMAVPHFRGRGCPERDRFARGAFVGVSTFHDHRYFVRAVFEGLCYELRSILEAAEKHAGNIFEEIVVIGGGARNMFWQELKATILNRRLVIPEISEGGALGAALLAACGSGIIRELGDVRPNVDKHILDPNTSLSEFYDDLYRNKYVQLYPLLKTLNKESQC